jgi:mono/diheme cytochrome c family protein
MKGAHVWLILFVVTGLGIAGAAISFANRPGGAVQNEAATRGAALYSEYCASCHGVNLAGEINWRTPREDGTLPAPPHDETGHTWHHGDGLLFSYTKYGGQAALEATGVSGFTSGMPGFADQLSDAEIWDILTFVKSTWPDRIQAIQSKRTEAEKAANGAQN